MEVARCLWVVYSGVVVGGLVAWWWCGRQLWLPFDEDGKEASDGIKLVVVRDCWGIV